MWYELRRYLHKKYDKCMLTIRRPADIVETFVENDEKINTGEVFSGSSSASRDISTVKNYGDIQLVVHTLPFLS